MLERIELIQGVGLLHDADGRRYRLHKATFIYADNGRGKSTLASVLRAASSADMPQMNSRKTVDGTLPPKAVLQFGSGHKVVFENNAWTEARPELLVFDADFVEKNVHSGGVVNTHHRKNLLDFALGESAVTARTEVQTATEEAARVGELILSYTGQLSGYHSGFTLKEFEELPELPDIDNLILESRQRIAEATNAATIQAKPIPALLIEPMMDFDALFSGLALSLADVHSDAERVVRDHVAKVGKSDVEAWLSEGQRFTKDDACPYCDQDIKANDLVKAYQTHFNEAYNDLKQTVTRLVEKFTKSTADEILVKLEQGVSLAVAQSVAWDDHVQTTTITFDRDSAATALSSLREIVLGLLVQKTDRPAEAIGSSEQRDTCCALWQTIIGVVRATNGKIQAAVELIEAYKVQLSAEDISNLNNELQRREATKRRYDSAAAALFANLAAARLEATRANTAKQSSREALDAQMGLTLTTYQSSINDILLKFGAGFRIEQLGGNFRGSAPRSEYGLLLRGVAIPLAGGPPSFATALSEGDKRTLAFAFFIARAIADPSLDTRIVVIDDPMCSLDLNRRKQTQVLLKKIHGRAKQLIVLAHDAYFLRDLRDAIRKKDASASFGYGQLIAVQNAYTSFCDLDLDKECESSYSQHHRLLNEYGACLGGDPAVVSKLIRPMLEGYLHRRFPGLVPKHLLFGQVVNLIKDAVNPSPLCHALNLVDELSEINDYAGEFHHETDGDANAASVNPAELRTYVQRALCIVHKGAPLS